MEQEIRDQLDAYLRGQLSLEDFRAWLLERTWDNPHAPQVAHAIEYFMDEASSGHLSLKEMKEELRQLAAEVPATA